jgi:nucleolar pre-ribosomal-associated protein 2
VSYISLQVLFDWISHALTGFYSKKVELPQVVVEGLWIYLDDILHSKKLHSVLSQGKTISLRLAVAQVSWS